MKLKKCIALLLSAVMMLTFAAPLASAAAAVITAPVVSVQSVTDIAGATVTVDVTIANNPGILGATLQFAFDDGLTLVSAESGDAFSALTMTKPGKFTSPCKFVWDGQEISADDIKDGTILTLQFEIDEDAATGDEYAIDVSYDDGDILDTNLLPIEVTTVSGGVTVVDYIYGDLNSDRKVNTGDIILLRRHIAGGYDQNIKVEAADVNVDDSVNSGDTILVRRFIAGGYGITFPYKPNGCTHVMQSYPAKEATEEEEGNIAYWYCKACNKYFADERGTNEIAFADTIIPKSEYTIQYMCDMVPLDSNNRPITYKPDTYKPTQTKVLPAPKMDQYEFLGWSDQNGVMYGKEIPQGTTGDLVLYANWVSHRNRAVKKNKLGDPIILEDSEKGILMFAYEIGTIEKVPLYTTLNLQCADGLITETSITEQTSISREDALEVAETISNATTNTTSWNLSNDWEKTTEKGNEIAQSQGETEEQYNSRINSSIFTKSESNSSGGSNSFISTNSSSYNVSANQSHRTDWGVDTESNYEYTTDDKISANLGAEIGAGWGPVSAKVEAGISTESSVHTSNNNKINTTNSGTDSWDTHMDSNQTNSNSSTSSKTWNSTSGTSSTTNATDEERYGKILSKEIAEKYSYGESYAEGGSRSETAAIESNDTTTNGRKSTVTYHTDEIEITKRTYQSDGNNFGDYRMVQAGTMHVFGVVRYDVATGEYSTYTYNVLDDETEEWLDYSYDGSFSDYESSVIPFEIPYYVNDYVNNRLYRTEGLKINAATGMIVGYTPTGDQPDNIVIIPSYWQIDNNDGTFSSVKITGIAPGLFENNTDIVAVKLGKFITEIPENTFSGCTNLEYVMAPSITSIGDNAFAGCESLAEFKISEDIASVGENAFVDAPSITAVASSVDVAKAIAESGAKNIVLDISKIPDDENSDLEIEVGEIESFELRGKDKEYKGLSVKSDAAATVINGVTFTENIAIPMELSSANVTLNRVTADCSGYALVLKADNTNVILNGTVNLLSSTDNAVLCKNLTLAPLNSSIVGLLNVTEYMLVCGKISDEYDCLTISDDKIIYITDEEYTNYLTAHKITFDANGGTVMTGSKMASLNMPVGELPTPSRDYYTFDGWYTEADGGEKVTADTPMTALTDITLYAHWVQNGVSAWVLASEAPSDAEIVNTKYSYTQTLYTTSNSSSLSGWTHYNTTSAWGEYGGWSDWSTSQYYASESREVQQETWSNWVDTSHYEARWRYYHWCKTSDTDIWTYSKSGYNYHEINLSYEMPIVRYGGGSAPEYGDYDCPTSGSKYWFRGGYSNDNGAYYNEVWVSSGYTNYYNVWRCRDRGLVYTYYFKKDEPRESSAYPYGSDISNIREWVQYRAK